MAITQCCFLLIRSASAWQAFAKHQAAAQPHGIGLILG